MQASEFRTAYELGKCAAAKPLSENPVLGIVKSFANDKRITHFDEDIQTVLEELQGTLSNANRIREARAELGLLITHFSGIAQQMQEQETEIIESRHDAGVTEEDCFRIVPIEKKYNRKVDREKLIRDFKPKFDLLLDNKKEELEETYTPSLKEIEAVFGKRAGLVIIPGGVQVIGHDIELAIPLPEKGSVEVEP